MIKIIENDITVDEYLNLRDRVNWKKLSHSQAQKALDNCLYVIKAVDDNGTPVGMGRIVGDGSVICYIQDLIVVPEAQGQKVGTQIITRLKKYVDDIRENGTTMMLCLMCAKGREEFYIKNDFIARPTDELGPGMILYLN